MAILLVEDDGKLAAALTEALRSEGMAINHVARGSEALHVAKTEPPEVIILDLGLPDMDGLDVLRTLRALLPELPVLLLTARSSVSDKVAGLDRGADDYLAKPLEMEELLARLRALRRRVNSAATGMITMGRVQLDTANHSAFADGEPSGHKLGPPSRQLSRPSPWTGACRPAASHAAISGTTAKIRAPGRRGKPAGLTSWTRATAPHSRQDRCTGPRDRTSPLT